MWSTRCGVPACWSVEAVIRRGSYSTWATCGGYGGGGNVARPVTICGDLGQCDGRVTVVIAGGALHCSAGAVADRPARYSSAPNRECQPPCGSRTLPARIQLTLNPQLTNYT